VTSLPRDIIDITEYRGTSCISAAMALLLPAKQAVIYFTVPLFCRPLPSRSTMEETEIVMGSDITGEGHFC